MMAVVSRVFEYVRSLNDLKVLSELEKYRIQSVSFAHFADLD